MFVTTEGLAKVPRLMVTVQAGGVQHHAVDMSSRRRLGGSARKRWVCCQTAALSRTANRVYPNPHVDRVYSGAFSVRERIRRIHS